MRLLLSLMPVLALVISCTPVAYDDDDEDDGGVANTSPWGSADSGASSSDTGEPDGGSGGGDLGDSGDSGDSGGSGDSGDSGDSDQEITLEDWCDRWKECGGTVYATAEECVDATYAYFGECAAMQAALDAYATCMVEVSCSDFDPDTYNPADTVCWREWEDILATDC